MNRNTAIGTTILHNPPPFHWLHTGVVVLPKTQTTIPENIFVKKIPLSAMCVFVTDQYVYQIYGDNKKKCQIQEMEKMKRS